MKNHSFRLLIPALAVLLAGQCAAQNTVEAAVINKNQPVKNLEAKDFKLTLDGKDQPITQTALGGEQRKQYYVLLFDLASLTPTDQADIRKYLPPFFDANAKPNRLFTILTYGGGLKSVQGFSNDAAMIKSAVERTVNGGGSVGTDWRNFVGAMTALSQSLAKVPGRKSILFFTNGAIPSSAPSESGGTVELDKLAAALNSADVVLHTISTNSSVERNFTSATDGMYVRLEPKLADGLVKVTDEQDGMYTLTYTSSGNLKPGCHKLSLKAAGGGNVKARNLICD